MKKKLEADLVSIAHRILKQKNREELDQLIDETLKLYEKLTVLKFVEDNFNDPLPTISYASAEKTLEEVYGLEDTPPAHEPNVSNEVAQPKADAPKTEDKSAEEETPAQAKENKSGEGVDTDADGEAPVAEAEEEAIEEQSDETAEPSTTEQVEEEAEEPNEETQEEPKKEEKATVEDKKEETEPEETPDEDKENKSGDGVDTDGDGKNPVGEPEKKEEAKEEEPVAHEVKAAVIVVDAEVGLHDNIQPPVTEVPEMPEIGELGQKDGEDKDNTAGEGVSQSGKAAVSEIEKEYTFATEPELEKAEPTKQKEISFEDFHDYKEPEFVKKGDTWPLDFESPKKDEPKFDWDLPNQEEAKPAFNWDEVSKPAEPKEEVKEDTRDWRDWEPAKSAEPEQPKAPEQPKYEAPKVEVPKSFNDGFTSAIALGLNDRIAFEKNLFAGSGEDLNRVISQLNTFNNFSEAKNFIDDLVKPDYNNWAGKEEYEERFMVLVEKKFS